MMASSHCLRTKCFDFLLYTGIWAQCTYFTDVWSTLQTLGSGYFWDFSEYMSGYMGIIATEGS